MFLSNHAAVGALLAVHTDNPASAFVLGYFSHYLLDMIPHGDEKVGTSDERKAHKFAFRRSIISRLKHYGNILSVVKLEN